MSTSQVTLSPSEYLSYVFGALYLGLWNLSFYPQLWETYKRRNTQAIAFEYAVLQCAAYFLFCIYAFVGRVEMLGRTNLQEEFEQIDKADVAFGAHAFFLSSVILTQSLVLPRGFIGEQRHLARWCSNLLGVIAGIILLSFAVEISIDEKGMGVVLPLSLQTQMISGYLVIIAHIAKYVPQFLRNQDRKSTVGLSVHMIFFDLLGSSFALLQLLMDALNLSNQTLARQQSEVRGASSAIVGSSFQYLNNLNMIKLFMTTVSIAFDFVFLVQHCLMYREAVIMDNRRKLFEQQREQRQEVTQLIEKKLKEMPELSSAEQQEQAHAQMFEFQDQDHMEMIEVPLWQQQQLQQQDKR